MNKFGQRIRPHVEAELQAATEAGSTGKSIEAFSHLERAHVLGQASTKQHVMVHWHMLVWAIRSRSLRECFGQAFRIVGAVTKTAFGLVPMGNTGGSNVSPFKPMPVPPELAVKIQEASS